MLISLRIIGLAVLLGSAPSLATTLCPLLLSGSTPLYVEGEAGRLSIPVTTNYALEIRRVALPIPANTEPIPVPGKPWERRIPRIYQIGLDNLGGDTVFIVVTFPKSFQHIPTVFYGPTFFDVSEITRLTRVRFTVDEKESERPRILGLIMMDQDLAFQEAVVPIVWHNAVRLLPVRVEKTDVHRLLVSFFHGDEARMLGLRSLQEKGEGMTIYANRRSEDDPTFGRWRTGSTLILPPGSAAARATFRAGAEQREQTRRTQDAENADRRD